MHSLNRQVVNIPWPASALENTIYHREHFTDNRLTPPEEHVRSLVTAGEQVTVIGCQDSFSEVMGKVSDEVGHSSEFGGTIMPMGPFPCSKKLHPYTTLGERDGAFPILKITFKHVSGKGRKNKVHEIILN